MLDGFRIETKLLQLHAHIFGQVFHGAHKIHSMPTANKIDRVAACIALGITAPSFMAGGISVHTECSCIVTMMQWTNSAQFSPTAMKFSASLLHQFIELYTR